MRTIQTLQQMKVADLIYKISKKHSHYIPGMDELCLARNIQSLDVYLRMKLVEDLIIKNG